MKVLTAPHLERAFNTDLKDDALHTAAKELSLVDFDTIVVCGMSGMVLGSILAHVMGKKLAVVRKKDEETVSCCARKVEGWHGGKYIFFDDLVSTGGTRRHARDEFEEHCRMENVPCQFMGTYTYDMPYWKAAT